MIRVWILLVLCATILPAAPALPMNDIDAVAVQFGEGPIGGAPESWFVPTPGWRATRVAERGPSGAHAIRLEKAGAGEAPFGNLMRAVPAKQLTGKRIALAAQIKVIGRGHAQMWLRVDRADGSVAAFDNMADRPVRGRGWQEARIEATLDATAESIAIGVMSMADAVVLIDDVRLTVLGDLPPAQRPTPPAPLTERGLENTAAAARLLSYLRFFHPSDQCVGIAAWGHVAVAVMDAAEPATDAEDLVERLGTAIADIAPTVQLWAGTPADAPPPSPVPEDATEIAIWHHRGAGSVSTMSMQSIYQSVVERHSRDEPPAEIDLSPVVVSLGAGVSVRIPIAVHADASGTLPHTPPSAWAAADELPPLTTENRTTRLASAALCWGVFRHFYPYFDVIVERWGIDWDEALLTVLGEAAEADGAAAHTAILQKLVAKLHDGHGNVFHPSAPAPTFLPLALEWAGDDLVVVGVDADVGPEVRVGDALIAIDGRAVEECHAEVAKRIAAVTEGFMRTVSAGALTQTLPTADPARLTLRSPDGATRDLHVRRKATPTPSVRAVGPVEIATPVGDPRDGIIYFDLRGAPAEVLIDHLVTLARARAIVFDMRGYPDSAAHRLMGHLIAAPAQSARWMTPVVRRPDGEAWTWDERGRWRLVPLEPRLDQPIAFLINGSAISYAESIMGIVEHYELGEIVGEPTAGTNGNVNVFELPGGDHVAWTGMKVLKHDGSTHHGVGILPTVPVEPTQRGIADGRDEVLDKAVEVLRARLATPDEP